VGPRPARDAWRSVCELFFDGEAQHRMHRACASVGLTPGQMRALLRLSPELPTAMRDLGDRWGCDASYVTALIDGLEERGLAARRPHPTDRRVKTVVLTTAGKRIRDRALEILHEPPAGFRALSAVEQRQLRDLLQKAAAADPLLTGSSAQRAQRGR
jgi:DNA-binding MarR family transcriptional regulator